MNDAVVYHSEIASQWESNYTSGAFSPRFEVILDLLANSDLRGQKWLDAGCGTGSLARFLAERKGCSVLGVDASDGMISNCTAAPNTEFAQIKDICETGLPDAAFQGVLCSSVIEYVPDPAVAVRELHRVLKKDGLLLLSAPNSHPLARWPVVILYWLTKRLGRRRMFQFLDYSRHSYSESGLCRLLESCGFRAETVRTYATWIGKKPILGHGTLVMVRARKV